MAPDQDPTDLHGLAVDAQTDLHKLATGLQSAGVAPHLVQEITQFAETLAEVAKVLGSQGAPPGGPGPAGPPPGVPGPAGPPPGGPAQGPPQLGAPAGGPPQAPPPTPQQQSLHHAATFLHHAMIQSAKGRQ